MKLKDWRVRSVNKLTKEFLVHNIRAADPDGACVLAKELVIQSGVSDEEYANCWTVETCLCTGRAPGGGAVCT